MSEKTDIKFWETDEYLKQNAAGAHSKIITLSEEVSELRAEVAKMSGKIEKYGSALFVGIFLLLFVHYLKH